MMFLNFEPLAKVKINKIKDEFFSKNPHIY